ncbi:hypothetical protein [Haliangium sp.]|uniref:hypothetical protein n=1 Tax=Haliangium sp. TaxID=2663208 RepID=UPI003D0FB643
MRALGLLLFVLGGAGTAFAVWATYHHGRPRDLLFAALAPAAMLLALAGLVLVFVPGFFG